MQVVLPFSLTHTTARQIHFKHVNFHHNILIRPLRYCTSTPIPNRKVTEWNVTEWTHTVSHCG